MKKILSLLTALMLIMAAIPMAAAEGEKLYEVTDTPDGWTKVENKDGATLGYSKKSGMTILEVDGYAFKDMDRDGELDVFEDWRQDYKTRAKALVDSGLLPTDWELGFKMNTTNPGAPSATELAEETKLQLQNGYRFLRFSNSPAEIAVKWNNLIQEYIETLADVPFVAATFEADPLHGRYNGVSNWPVSLGVAATFDPEIADLYGKTLSEEWRALGISMKVAPQVDLATEPRWHRLEMTFGEDPQLSMDMARAMVNAWQSSYDEEGNDLGWGKDSVNCQVKHVMAEGAGEAGREAHGLDGAYNVFPGGQFYTDILPYFACQDLPGKTETVSCAMTNYSIAVDENGDSIGGERVATSFNSWKINELWRGLNNWDGYILTDFDVESSKCYGVEDLTVPERLLKVLEAGCDAWGGFGGDVEAHMAQAREAYEIGVNKLGQEGMDDLMNLTTYRTMNTLFNVGLMDNPYLSTSTALEVCRSEKAVAAGFDAQVKSVVMLKNSGNLIKPAGEEKLTVYIPYKFTAAGFRNPASVGPCMDLKTAMKYFNVVTDKPAAPSGENGTYTADDIVRAPAEEIAKCDFALVRICSPAQGNPITGYSENMTVPEDYEYLPISLQYRPYTADNMYVRFESMGGQITMKEVDGTYGKEYIYEKENRSYFGKTGIINNESDLDFVLYAASVCDKVVCCVDCSKPAVFSELEPSVDALIVDFGGSSFFPANEDAAIFEIVSGRAEPSGLLPIQFPANMETVEAQYEDVPRDMECYVDADGNTYDFTFGLNWSGVINDERVAKYNVPPIVGEDPFLNK